MMNSIRLVALCIVFVSFSFTASAAIFGPGKHFGVPAYDRWDACILTDGWRLDYISEHEKDKLRPFTGKYIRMDVTDYLQPVNPGHALIKAFSDATLMHQPADEPIQKDLKLNTRFSTETTEICIEILNIGKETQDVSSGMIFPILLQKKHAHEFFDASDGPSHCIMWGRSFGDSAEEKPIFETKGGSDSTSNSWSIGKENALPRSFHLKAGEKKTIRMKYDLPEGEYDFFCRYSSTLISNFTAFNVTAGRKIMPCDVKRK